MGSEVQLEHYMPGYCSKELREEASSYAWNYYDRQFHGAFVDFDSECDKDELKQKMLEHDSVFRKQVSELHRLYKTQRDLMDEMKRSELYSHHRPLSMNPLLYQRQDSSKVHSPNIPSSNSACTSPSNLGAQQNYPNLSHLKRKAPNLDLLSVIDVNDSKDCEIIECRPGKARKQMFDLQLSADACIFPDELNQSSGLKAHIPSSSRNGQSFFGGTSRSTNKVSGKNDLNEPIQIDDDPPTFDFMKSGTSGNSLYSNPLSVPTPPKNYSRGSSFNSRYGGDFIDSKKQLLVDRDKSAHASHQLGLGQLNANASSSSQYLRPKSCYKPSQFMPGKYGMPNGTSISVLAHPSKEVFWKDRVVYSSNIAQAGLESRIQYLKHVSDVKCWPPQMASWDNYNSNSSQKQPYFNSSAGLTKSSQASNQHSNIIGEKLNMTSGYVVGIPRIHELDHGSSSNSKEESICYPSVKLENLGSSKDDAGASGCSGNVASLTYSKGLNGFDLNCCKGMDLSAPVTSNLHLETVPPYQPQHGSGLEQSKHATLLPWMKPKPFSNDNPRANFSQTSNKFLNKIAESASRDHGIDFAKPASDHYSKYITGLPVLSQPLTAGSFRLSKGHKTELKQKRQIFDMNMPCETETNMEIVTADEIVDKKVTGFKNTFDLNSCLTEESSPHSASSVVRNVTGIDLEAPAPHETDEYITFVVTQQKPLEAELEHVAAEAMVFFSSFRNSNIMETAADTATETLKWFAGVVSSCPSDSEQQNDELIMRTSEDTDHFEQMTLNLTEMSAEESMPKSAFPTIPNIEEEPANDIPSARPRRGQARRGRPKRDFQRDILPSLTSLSRHEVTEDLQALDGLMRSSGHAWQFGKRAAARNKPRRGRPRTVSVIPYPDPNPIPIPIPIYPSLKQPTISCIGAGIEEQNLTGWGKTTRRPRRQRCPAGNLQPVRLN